MVVVDPVEGRSIKGSFRITKRSALTFSKAALEACTLPGAGGLHTAASHNMHWQTPTKQSLSAVTWNVTLSGPFGEVGDSIFVETVSWLEWKTC
jgi:hypothetical protein